MASPGSLTEQFDTLYNTTWNLRKPEVSDVIFGATPVWWWMYNKARVDREVGGRWLQVDLMYGKNTTFGWIGPGGTVDISFIDPETAAKFDWRWCATSVTRLFTEDTMNTGKARIRSIVETKLKNAELSVIDQMEVALFGDGTGSGGKAPDGLGNLVSATAGLTVGGINSGTYGWWENKRRAFVVASTDADNGLKRNMTTQYNDVSIGNDHPSLGVMTQAIYEQYELGLANILRVYDNDMGDAGFESLRFKGMGLVYSPSSPSGELRMLNERYMLLKINPNAEFMMTDWKPIPNQLDRVAQIVLQLDVCVNNRRMHSVMTGVA